MGGFSFKKIGFGLELSKCILSNKKTNLSYVSPKSGCAVNKEAGNHGKKIIRITKVFNFR